MNRVSEVLKTLPKEEIVEEEDKVIYTLDDDKEEFTVRKDGDTFVVEGKAVNRLMGRINCGPIIREDRRNLNRGRFKFTKRIRN